MEMPDIRAAVSQALAIEQRKPRQAAVAMRDSQWWLTCSIALAQTGGTDPSQ
jgi:hypothetical protein